MGIIASFKVKYQSYLMEYIHSCIVGGNQSPFKINEISVARAAPWIAQALNATLPATIQSCFYNALKMEKFKPVQEHQIQEELMDLGNAIERL